MGCGPSTAKGAPVAAAVPAAPSNKLAETPKPQVTARSESDNEEYTESEMYTSRTATSIAADNKVPERLIPFSIPKGAETPKEVVKEDNPADDLARSHMIALKRVAKDPVARIGEYMKILNVLSRISADETYSSTRNIFTDEGLTPICINDIKKCNVRVVETIAPAQFALDVLIQLCLNDNISEEILADSSLVKTTCDIFMAAREFDLDTESELHEPVAELVSSALRFMWTLVVDSTPAQAKYWVQNRALEYCFSRARDMFENPPEEQVMVKVLSWCFAGIRVLCRTEAVRANEDIALNAAHLAVNFLKKMEDIAMIIEQAGHQFHAPQVQNGGAAAAAAASFANHEPNANYDNFSDEGVNLRVRTAEGKSSLYGAQQPSVHPTEEYVNGEGDMLQGDEHDAMIVEHCAAILNYLQDTRALTARISDVKGIWEALVSAARRFRNNPEMVHHSLQALGKAMLNFDMLKPRLLAAGLFEFAVDIKDSAEIVGDEDLITLSEAIQKELKGTVAPSMMVSTAAN